MAVLEWDSIQDRKYQTGVNKGVLYLKDGTVVPWNGLISVEDSTGGELKSFYLDGVKILDHVTPGDFSGKLSAFTYPDEFEEVIGASQIVPGLTFYEQQFKSFDLSWQTRVGNPLDENLGYKIHLLYNVMAVPDSHTYSSIQENIEAPDFTWALSATPPIRTIDGFRPTTHISIDSITSDPDLLQQLEDTLYGTDVSDPRLPSISEVGALFAPLIITDNGDGTWTAEDPTDTYINMLNPTTFEIDRVTSVTYLDPYTYEISSINF